MDEPDLYHYHGMLGDRIRITTQDDVGVVTVNVTLTTINGTIIERGQAIEQWAGSGSWEYVATVSVASGTEVLIEAAAYDRPGHRAVVSANCTVPTEN